MTTIDIIGDLIWTGFQIAAACAAVFAVYLTAAVTIDAVRTARTRRRLRRPPYDWKTRL